MTDSGSTGANRAAVAVIQRKGASTMRGEVVAANPAKKAVRAAVALLCAAFAVGVVTLVGAPRASASSGAIYKRRPILFVHGVLSNGGNFESQVMRFESNGYRKGWVETISYDSLAAAGEEYNGEVEEQIEKAIAKLKERTGASQVDLIGHSEGTKVIYHYLTESLKAAEHDQTVAAYVNIDGQEKLPPVRTLALWAEKSQGTVAANREIPGATNVLIPNETHVQSSTSATSFIQMYKFLRGNEPRHDIRPMRNKIQIAGHALDFPNNTGLVGDTLVIWPVNSEGFRYTSGRLANPVATIPITKGGTGEGEWGPVTVQARQRYEFELEQPGEPTLHIYYPNFTRNDYQLGLLASPAIEASGMHAGSVGILSLRFKEMWGNAGELPGSSPEEDDEVKVNGLNVCVPSICPLTKLVNGLFVGEGPKHPKETNLEEPNPLYSGIPFITGAEVYIPATSTSEAADIPTESVKVQLDSRGEGPTGSAQAKEKTLEEVDVPNWNSATDQVEIYWHDYQKLTFEP
jgi:Lipase C-terminal domain/AF_1763-like, C-terminal domain/Lipase (class 2)